MKKILFSILLTLLVPLFSHAQINVQTTTTRSDIELVWEAHSYLPPLYRGKALYPIGGEVTVWAIPPASLGNPTNLTYTWKRNGVVDGALSGVGKRSYTFSGSEFGETPFIVVEVANSATSVFGALRIIQASPVIRFYENRALGGIAFEHALSKNVLVTEKTFGIEAYPFFFSADTRSDSTLKYDWSINGQRATNAVGGSVSVASEEARVVPIQLSMHHIQEILQRASEGTSLTFE